MSTPEASIPKIVSIQLAGLQIHPVAKRDYYKESDLKALGRSLQENGQLHPVLVREIDGKFELLAGTRRVRAAQSVGLKTLSATVCRATDAQALELIGVENLLRANLNPLERSRYVIELMRPVAYGGGGLTVDQVRVRFGRSSDWVRKTCKLSQVPEPWRSQLAAGKLSEAVVLSLFPYLDRPAVLKAIERHQAKEPKLWRTREDWQRLAKMINDKFNELGDQEGWTEGAAPLNMDREKRATLSVDLHAEERIERQADKVEEAMEESQQEVLESLGHSKRLSLKAARGLIEPFANSKEDLRTVIKACTTQINALANQDK